MACNLNCAPTLSALVLPGCTIVPRTGGIKKIAYQKCNASFEDASEGGITDIDAWTDGIEAGDIVVTGDLLAQKPKGSTTKTRVASCLPEVVTGQQQTVQFRDYNADSDTMTEFDFYNSITENYASLNLLLITCDDRVYLYDAGTWSIELDDVIPETVEEGAYMDGTILINKLGLAVPVSVPGLTDAI